MSDLVTLLWTPDILPAAVVIAAAGFVHGYTGGFGAGLLMVPVLSLYYGPIQAIATSCIMGLVAAIPLVRGAARALRVAELLPLLATATIATPLAAQILLGADGTLMRRIIGALVVLSALLLATGWTYAGRRDWRTGSAAGLVSGLFSGMAGMSGPVLAVYYLSAPEPPAVIRAQIVFAVAGAIVITLATLSLSGEVLTATYVRSGSLLPLHLLLVGLGAWAFRTAPARWFRPAVLGLLVAIGVYVVVA